MARSSEEKNSPPGIPLMDVTLLPGGYWEDNRNQAATDVTPPENIAAVQR
jgi:hypothetical protein